MYRLLIVFMVQFVFGFIFLGEFFIENLEIVTALSILNLVYLFFGVYIYFREKKYTKMLILIPFLLVNIYVLIGSIIFRDGIL